MSERAHQVLRSEQRVELGVALVDAGLHARGQPGVPALEAVHQRLGVQPGAAVAEILEPQRLEGDVIGHALEGEGLHDLVLADGVEAAPEAELLAVARRDIAPAAAVADVPLQDPGCPCRRVRSSGRTAPGRCAPPSIALGWRGSRE